MRKNLIIPPDKFRSSFLSCEKDAELICKKLFLESLPYSNELKRLLIINAKDCLDNTENEQYREKINLSFQIWLQKLACIGLWYPAYFLRCTCGNNSSASVSAFRSHVNYIVRSLYHIQIMLNYNYRISAI